MLFHVYKEDFLVKITNIRCQIKATKAIRPKMPPMTPPTMGAMLDEGLGELDDVLAGRMEVATTVYTMMEPLGCVEVDVLVRVVGVVG